MFWTIVNAMIPQPLRRLSLAISAAVIVAGTVGVLVSSNAADDRKAAAPRPALTVTTAKPEQSRLPLSLAANGNVAAWQEAVIGSESKRARALQSSGALSEQQITQYITAERTAAARVASAKATLAQQQLRLKHTKIVAPDAGLISARSATVGAVAGVGTEMFRMIRQGRLEWRAEVTAAELPRIKPGQKVVVRTVAPTVDAQSRVALVYVDLPPALSANAPLKAGMFASGQFALGESAALTVPQQAVAVRDGFAYVFRLNADGRVSQLKVTTGRRLGDRVEVTGGLPADALVVTSGAGFLNDGDLVRNAPASAPAALAAR